MFRSVPKHVGLVESLCRESGRWLLVGCDNDEYRVRANDHKPPHEITVRGSDRPTVLFQTWFPIRFRLENPPSGLFARVLLRNLDLHFSGWAMSIGESCEACLTISAFIPRSVLDPVLFDVVCREITDEVLGFHHELHEKFAYSVPSSAAMPPGGGYGPAAPSVPALRDGRVIDRPEEDMPRQLRQIVDEWRRR